ncbi:MAG TPA: hypothetical protein PK640_21620, partial [Verrucomicrobiota bacterium]|nr:hypothetical protein [Verrucomicrobiota bacterium]
MITFTGMQEPGISDEAGARHCVEWNRKGATLSDVTARAEYGVSRDFIIKGIQCGKPEYREGSIW